MKKRMGRPRLPKGKTKKPFSVRLSPDELKFMETEANKAGQSVSEWARNRLLDGHDII